MSTNSNDQQAQSLIEALAPRIAEAILPKITEHVEGQIKGLKDKSSELLDKLAKKSEPNVDALLAAAEAQIQARLNGTNFKADDATAPIVISKSDARDVRKYRAAREEAAKRGVQVQIEGR